MRPARRLWLTLLGVTFAVLVSVVVVGACRGNDPDEVRKAVYRHLLGKGSKATLYVVDNDAVVAALNQEMGRACLVPASYGTKQPDGAFVDKVTGQPAMLINTEFISQSPFSATVGVKWYTGNIGMGSKRVMLRKNLLTGRWYVTGVVDDQVS
jgi:hypothetical protein